MGSPPAVSCSSVLVGHAIDLYTRQSAKLEVQSYSKAEIQRRVLGWYFDWPGLA